ncbi:hypothetical protein TB2_045459 [Malus domestica]|uniref:G-type lectin S-receptor-like serine/threonine-protein kinase At4g03230 n=1 Tax=Malus domestica TaxID=3750 RepID=UPI0010AB219C|nr:G-type lectin S-receptor-like serine/threonine-protein kinase At4g03230 [Malus domestica]
MMFLRGRLTRSNYVVASLANRMLFSIFVSYAAVLLCSSQPFCCARDTITHDTPITDGVESETLVSSGGRFELGFFSPSPEGTQRYVGIWYHQLSPRTVVWVANREKPVDNSTSNGSLALQDGNLHVLDAAGNRYWSTEVKTSESLTQTVTLMDSGNFVLSSGHDKLAVNILWQSFQSPTDTFIPGMVMDKRLVLTSWRGEDDPKSGQFIFKKDLVREDQYVISKSESIPYWKGGERASDTIDSFDQMLPEVSDLLSNFSKKSVRNFTNIFNSPSQNSSYRTKYTRLVINITGEIQFWRWINSTKQWNLYWWAPRDKCSVFNACGNFGSCNDNNMPFLCKCLPGFKPQYLPLWNSGDVSGGCTRKSALCDDNKNYTFLSLKKMKVGNPDSESNIDNETECRNGCLNNCLCKAYSYAKSESNSHQREAPTSLCRIWNVGDLNNLEEEYTNTGQDLYVRVALSDLESTLRDCKPCGTTIIPYPLSTRLGCGDPLYFRFKCNYFTGQVSFVGLNDALFRVISINSSTQRFFIQGFHTENVDNSDPRNRAAKQINPSFPFKVISPGNADLANFSSEVLLSSGPNVVEMGWKLPMEPNCTTSADCRDWAHSICKRARGGKKRCLCETNFRWNGLILRCTQEGNLLGQPKEEHTRRKLPLSLIIVAVLLSVIFLACIVISIYIWRRNMNNKRDQIRRGQFDSERRVKELIDTSEFKEEEGIDVPFFDMQTILDATDNFSNANKLGQGGYGPVYKGMFLGGQEIAVKRLSRVSGQGLQEFRNEVVLIAKLQHRNLVRLKGYCMKGEEKILLYEYMPNKSLDYFIFDHTKSMFLNWEMRFSIILGIARGLLYLHQDSRLRIIHRDLKTSNILLDEEMNPKISDFGLARIVGGKETQANTNTVVGTYGYMAPEYALDGTFSVKSDVFSFGVVLLEIISGKKNTGFYQSEQTFSLINYAWRLWTENKVLDLMDKTLDESCNKNQFIQCVNVGLLCVQEDPNDRPAMSNVITMLDSETATSPAPKQPGFLTRRGNSSTASSSKPETISELTTSIVEGR